MGLPRAELESRIEGIVGDALHGTDAYWGDLDGDRYVEVTGKDDQRVHVTVDLSADVPGWDAEVDLSFDLKFTGACSDGQTPLELHITTENVSAGADLDWYTELLTLGLANLAEGGIADRVVDAFPDLDKTITINTDETVCVTPVVIQSGDVVFTVTRTQKPNGKPASQRWSRYQPSRKPRPRRCCSNTLRRSRAQTGVRHTAPRGYQPVCS